MYETAALKNPFKSPVAGEKDDVVAYATILFDKVPDLGSQYSDEFKQAISQMMQKDFHKRPTAKQMLEEPLMKRYSVERVVNQQQLFSVYGHKMLAAQKEKK